MSTRNKRLVPYGMVSPGWEAVYTGEKADPSTDVTDDEGSVFEKWSVWPFQDGAEQWASEIQRINEMQARLGELDCDTRQIRAHIASLTPCDGGFPVAVDEILSAIGRGKLDEPSFRNGCWMGGMWWEMKSSQPRHLESMRVVHDVLTGWLAGKPEADFLAKYPHAEAFVRRTYTWLGSAAELTAIQKLLIERAVLPFQFFTKASHADPRPAWAAGAAEACEAAMKNCYQDGGRGAEIDAKIAELAGLPKISMKYPDQARQSPIDDPRKMDLYVLCCALAHGLHTLSDCHHGTFRWIEDWIHAIGTGQWGIPTRAPGAARRRLGRLLFGYLLGLDKWLSGVPMQFLLLDLGHVDLGFDPDSEIVRVYAHLGDDRTPVREWLAACLWHNLMHNTAGLLWQDKHKELLERAQANGVGAREWKDSVLQGPRGGRQP